MEEFTEGHKDMMEPPNTRNPPERCPRPLYSRDSTQEGLTIPHYNKGEDLIDIKVEVKSEEEERYVRDDQQSMEEDGITGTFIEEDTPISWDSTQEGHTIPHHHQSGNLGDYNIVVKEEYKEEDEEYGVMEEFSEEYKGTMEPPNTRNPPERCPRPLYSRDSTQEDHSYIKNDQGEDLIGIKVEVKSEEEERYVRDDQQSMEEDGITGTFIEEDTPTEISTGGSLTLNTFLHPYCSLIGPE
ncbi:uncharacterized protein [Aquarana catesbeiana]|uniref:uncharacterized protein n=1 Tax=Aquarana catesbeiana TaxID=8400 RepID=UPI003CC9CDA5